MVVEETILIRALERKKEPRESERSHQVPKRTLIGQYAMSGNCDLFGEPEVHCCSSVDNSRTNVTSVLAVRKSFA